MQEQAWIEIIRRIPAQFHDGMVLATVAGAELVLQAIIRLDDEFLIFKGRPSGTSDAGKLMVLPYHRINYLFYPKQLSDPQMQSMFGGGELSFAVLPTNLPAAAPKAAPEPTESLAEEALPANGIAELPTPESSESSVHHSKSLLLAKLRAKLAGNGRSPR